jgi:transcriptional regulator with XRE-family HTH domain
VAVAIGSCHLVALLKSSYDSLRLIIFLFRKHQLKPLSNAERSGGKSLHGPAAALKDSPVDLQKSVGGAVRELRLRRHLTIAQVAVLADISDGMLSKIENGQISAGLDTLSRVARALGSTMAMLFRTYDVPAGAAHLVKSGLGMPFLRHGKRPGHTFQLLSYDQGQDKLFDCFLVTIEEQSESLPTSAHPGVEIIHMLEGSFEYRSGQSIYLVEPGDTLTLQGDVLHGPERLVRLPIRFVCTIVYPTTPPQD